MRSFPGRKWCVVFFLAGCGSDGRTPPTQPETPTVDAGDNTERSPGIDTDTGETLGPIAQALPGGSGSGAAAGYAGFGGLGGYAGVSGKDPIAH
jgi:hypothetical protein